MGQTGHMDGIPMKRLLLLVPLLCSAHSGFGIEADIQQKCLKASACKGSIEAYLGIIKDQSNPARIA